MSEDTAEENGTTSFPEESARHMLTIEAQVREYLNEILKLKFRSEYEEARKRIRNFGDPEGDYAEIFAIVMLAVRGPDEFFKDAEETLSDSEFKRLKHLHRDYEDLSDDFAAVYFEIVEGTYNPIDSYSWETEYTGDKLLLKYREQSGSLRVLETHDTVDEIFDQARTRIASIRNALETAIDEQDYHIDTSLQGELTELTDDTEEELTKIRNIVSDMEGDSDA